MTFKNFSDREALSRRKSLIRNEIRFVYIALLLVAMTFPGCALLRPKIAPANLEEPGWTIREGQAVWRPAGRDLELAGDLLLASRPDGNAFVQFTKSPFPLLVAQSTTNKWAVSIPAENKHYGGKGRPPKRVIWLYLPGIIAGKAPPKGWTWRQDDKGWRLENHLTGETLEGYFNE